MRVASVETAGIRNLSQEQDSARENRRMMDFGSPCGAFDMTP